MEIDWKSVERILLVRLRSIGDSVLTTPTIIALRDFLPNAQIDILLEDWVAPVFEGFDAVDEILIAPQNSAGRIRTGLELRRKKYDVAINLHGGTTAGFLVRLSGARYRIGYKDYQYSFLYNFAFPGASEFWKKKATHSAEQQAALAGYAGVPMEECPKSALAVTDKALESAAAKIKIAFPEGTPEAFVLIHPTAASDTKRWSTENYASLIKYFGSLGIPELVVSRAAERSIILDIETSLGRKLRTVVDAPLPEITALCSLSKMFVGNDSGIAHIAAAVAAPLVVIFGSSNINHWKPWTNAPNRVVFEEFACQPCPGDICREFGEPRCIQSVRLENVTNAVDEILAEVAEQR